MFLYQPAAMEFYTLTIADSERLKNGKSFLFLVALLCTISLLGHAACCGSYGINVVESCELVIEGGASSIIQPDAVMVAAHDINSTGLADYGRFELSSNCSVVSHIIGHDDGSFYIYKPFCVISRLGPVEVTSIWIGVSSEHVNKEMYIVTMPDDLVIGSWKTEVIDTLVLVLFTVQLGAHQSMWVTGKNWCQQPIIMQLILNSEEVVDECRFPKPIPYWSRLKKNLLVLFIMIILVSCVVLPQLIENGRISSASVPNFVGKASNLNFKFRVLASSGANGLSGTIGQPDAKMIESFSKPSSEEEPEHDPCSGNDTSIPEKRDTIVAKEKSSRKRWKRRSSGSSGSSSSQTHSSSSTAAVADDLAFGSVMEPPPPVKMEDKKPKETIKMEEYNNSLVLFPFANDPCLLISTSTIALHARAPGPKNRIQTRLNTTTAIIHDQYQYDMWADHLSEMGISEIWNSFFVMGQSVSSPHKGD